MSALFFLTPLPAVNNCCLKNQFFLLVCNFLSNVVDPKHCVADPDPSFLSDADPDPTFHFDADPNPHQSDANLRSLVLQTLHVLHCSPHLLNFYPDADPDASFDFDAAPDPLLNMIRILPDQVPQHCSCLSLSLCPFF